MQNAQIIENQTHFLHSARLSYLYSSTEAEKQTYYLH